VQVSPISIIVAVAEDLSVPPQQVEMFGHRASSQTVCRPSPRRSDFMRVKLAPVGTGVLSQVGRRVIGFPYLSKAWGLVVVVAEASSSASSALVIGAVPFVTKSEKEGPALSLSVKVVGGRFLPLLLLVLGGWGEVVARCRVVVVVAGKHRN